LYFFPSLPVTISPIILKSLMNDQNGCPNVAGLFFSSTKCPVHANPYPMGKNNSAYHGCPVTNAPTTTANPNVVPIACRMRFRGSLCCRK